MARIVWTPRVVAYLSKFYATANFGLLLARHAFHLYNELFKAILDGVLCEINVAVEPFASSPLFLGFLALSSHQRVV